MTPDAIKMLAGLAGIALIVAVGKLALIPSSRLGVGVFRPYRGDPWPVGVQEDDDARFNWVRPAARTFIEPRDDAARDDVAWRFRAGPEPETPGYRRPPGDRPGRPSADQHRRPPCQALIPGRGADGTPMSIDTPGWVRDAVFYQVFPDRFARSGRVHAPGPLEPWDSPPTVERVQGRRPVRRRRPPRPHRGPRRHRDLPQPDLRLGLEPPVPHVRLLPGRPAPGWRRGLPRAARRGPRARHPGRHRRRVQPLRPRILAVPQRPRAGRRVALPRLVLPQPGVPADAGTPLRAYGGPPGPALDLSAARPRRPRRRQPRCATSATRPGGTCRALPKLNVRNPEVREYLLGVGGALDPVRASTAGAWTSRRTSPTPTSGASSGSAIRAINPDAYILAEIWFPSPRCCRATSTTPR